MRGDDALDLLQRLTTQDLHAVWGLSPTEVYVVGDGGTALRYDGTSWSPIPAAPAATLEDVWAAAGDAVYVIDDAGTIHFFDGSVWSVTTQSQTGITLRALWGYGREGVYAAGDIATVMHFSR